jgi:hypothetical protein
LLLPTNLKNGNISRKLYSLLKFRSDNICYEKDCFEKIKADTESSHRLIL